MSKQINKYVSERGGSKLYVCVWYAVCCRTYNVVEVEIKSNLIISMIIIIISILLLINNNNSHHHHQKINKYSEQRLYGSKSLGQNHSYTNAV